MQDRDIDAESNAQSSLNCAALEIDWHRESARLSRIRLAFTTNSSGQGISSRDIPWNCGQIWPYADDLSLLLCWNGYSFCLVLPIGVHISLQGKLLQRPRITLLGGRGYSFWDARLARSGAASCAHDTAGPRTSGCMTHQHEAWNWAQYETDRVRGRKCEDRPKAIATSRLTRSTIRKSFNSWDLPYWPHGSREDVWSTVCKLCGFVQLKFPADDMRCLMPVVHLIRLLLSWAAVWLWSHDNAGGSAG
ncbi:hypothetical protein EJ03DRAFT_159212 [Teratosphaeria nubilosa]|uniref:Uncharacterized protein n=1 Tax=Teratosphaeria nubilosa TaxID=161662 RepID=A0A6G1L3N7_9PEZI|nr:hypothetical protein EJ03DRAFT_159212 [Teratosphaeria nubilosa]